MHRFNKWEKSLTFNPALILFNLVFFSSYGHNLIKIQINDEHALIIDILFNCNPMFMCELVIICWNVDANDRCILGKDLDYR